MKLVIVGGASQSTPWLFATESAQRIMHDLDVVLLGRNEERLQAVARAIERLGGPSVAVATTSCEERALEGADLIVLQARYGGYSGRAHDERFPLAFGIPGDEGLGPGGLASAWRSWSALRETLATIARRAPSASIALLTAPLGILTRCARASYPQLDLAGLCELPWVTLENVCAATGTAAARVHFDYAGVNHLGWFDRIECDGKDLIEEYAAGERRSFPSGDVIRACGALPLAYQRLRYERADVVAEQRQRAPRATTLARASEAALEAFAHRDTGAIRDALDRRPAPWYTAAVAPWLAARVCPSEADGTVLFLTTENNGYLGSVGSAEIVERPFRIRGSALDALERSHVLAENLRAELQELIAYERIAAEAVMSRSRARAAEALAAHPWIEDASVVSKMADDVCGADELVRS